MGYKEKDLDREERSMDNGGREEVQRAAKNRSWKGWAVTALLFTGIPLGGCEGKKQQGCEGIEAAVEKDQCLIGEIQKLNGPQMTEVIKKAKEIQDPMIRGAAVSSWVRDHNNEINQRQGKALCEILDGRDRFYCMRRLSSPHLKR
jgi:hypothetical protein